jgi:hypothetical protein
MKNSDLRNILKNTSPSNFNKRVEAITKYPIRSKTINDAIHEARQRLQAYRNSPTFRKRICEYVGMSFGSDVHAYEVLNTISPQTVEIRLLEYKQTVFPKEFQIGGFSAHCADNYNQEYSFNSNEDYPIIRIRWSNAKGRWQYKGQRCEMSNVPIKFYDNNF